VVRELLDNALGIPRDQLSMALKRHATSKIASLADLESVGTMGFRGEALDAINSIADCAILSKASGPICGVSSSAAHGWVGGRAFL
jgi:DNA mismatch repair protein MutL